MDRSVLLLFLLVLLFQAASDSDELRPHPGEDVTLPCWAGNASIRAVEWTRANLESSQCVLFYRDGHSHTPYVGRVQLVDGELKDGDVSLILRNVSIDDSGKYECRVSQWGSEHDKRAIMETEPIRIIRLEVTDSGSTTGNIMDGNQINTNLTDGNRSRVGLGAGVGLFCLVVVVVVVVVILKYKRQTPEASAANEAVGD